MKNQVRNGIDSSIENNIETQGATLSITNSDKSQGPHSARNVYIKII